MERFRSGGEIVWRPTREYVEDSHLKRFMHRHGIASFNELMERSTSNLDADAASGGDRGGSRRRARPKSQAAGP